MSKNNYRKIKIDKNDLKIETFRSGGKGGQNVNKTATAVRITYIPDNIVVVCQDERSQYLNKKKALDNLKEKIYNIIEKEKKDNKNKERKEQINNGEMAKRIRTYNFKNGEVIDYRVNNKRYKLNKILDGELDDMIKEIKYNKRYKNEE